MRYIVAVFLALVIAAPIGEAVSASLDDSVEKITAALNHEPQP